MVNSGHTWPTFLIRGLRPRVGAHVTQFAELNRMVPLLTPTGELGQFWPYMANFYITGATPPCGCSYDSVCRAESNGTTFNPHGRTWSILANFYITGATPPQGCSCDSVRRAESNGTIFNPHGRTGSILAIHGQLSYNGGYAPLRVFI